MKKILLFVVACCLFIPSLASADDFKAINLCKGKVVWVVVGPVQVSEKIKYREHDDFYVEIEEGASEIAVNFMLADAKNPDAGALMEYDELRVRKRQPRDWVIKFEDLGGQCRLVVSSKTDK